MVRRGLSSCAAGTREGSHDRERPGRSGFCRQTVGITRGCLLPVSARHRSHNQSHSRTPGGGRESRPKRRPARGPCPCAPAPPVATRRFRCVEARPAAHSCQEREDGNKAYFIFFYPRDEPLPRVREEQRLLRGKDLTSESRKDSARVLKTTEERAVMSLTAFRWVMGWKGSVEAEIFELHDVPCEALPKGAFRHGHRLSSQNPVGSRPTCIPRLKKEK
ncbi:hypothetical protein SKAU_G00383180 [Synaphobranchus kaupii]|uniref:Uncharacterized protein n=1 Tax=Synaphobranchus kaupii TaxID=118154 RepID=A0A9Q1EE35_SYNKA|nr:hypothetical protein SKAU_G00383180 [Synaphobranchus kaupii]